MLLWWKSWDTAAKSTASHSASPLSGEERDLYVCSEAELQRPHYVIHIRPQCPTTGPCHGLQLWTRTPGLHKSPNLVQRDWQLWSLGSLRRYADGVGRHRSSYYAALVSAMTVAASLPASTIRWTLALAKITGATTARQAPEIAASTGRSYYKNPESTQGRFRWNRNPFCKIFVQSCTFFHPWVYRLSQRTVA